MISRVSMIDSYSSDGMTASTGLPRRVTATVARFSASFSGKVISSLRALAIGISRIISVNLLGSDQFDYLETKFVRLIALSNVHLPRDVRQPLADHFVVKVSDRNSRAIADWPDPANGCGRTDPHQGASPTPADTARPDTLTPHDASLETSFEATIRRVADEAISFRRVQTASGTPAHDVCSVHRRCDNSKGLLQLTSRA